MKHIQFLNLCILLVVGFLLISCSETSPTDVEELITQSWYGEEFLTRTVGDTTLRGKDFVATFEFKNDGSYYFEKFTMSHPGEVGRWSLKDGETSIKLTHGSDYSEIYDIKELTASSFVMGDTNSHGFKLVSSNQ